MSPLNVLAVFIGGGAGATCRYGLGRSIGERYDGAFPLGTFVINVTGCFALGLLASVIIRAGQQSSLLTALIATGFLGGYTTFSTYALEGVILYADGSRRIALLSLLAPVVLGLLAAGLGATLGKAWVA
jgi:CrcB protein